MLILNLYLKLGLFLNGNKFGITFMELGKIETFMENDCWETIYE